MNVIGRIVTLTAFLAAAGCGGSATTTTVLPDGGAGDAGDIPPAPADGGADDADGGPAACNALELVGAPVRVHDLAGDPPAPQGGPVADGTYVLTDVAVYVGAGGPSGATGEIQMTLHVTGNRAEIVSMRSGGTVDRASATFVSEGTTLTTTDTCPDTRAQRVAYTATPSSLMVFLPDRLADGGTRTQVEIFGRQ